MELIKRYFGYFHKASSLLGKSGTLLFGVGLLFSFLLSGIEYCIALFLMVFLFSLGFVDYFQLPSWLPFDVRSSSPLFIWTLLLLIGVMQAVCKIVNNQTRVMLTERTQARMRMVLGYKILKNRSNSYMALSKVNLYMAEHFPKATGFVFNFTHLISFFILAIMIGLGMFYFAKGAAMVGIIGLFVMGCLVFQFNRITNRVSKKVPEIQAGLERTKVRIVRNWLLIKILRIQDKEYENYLNSTFHYYKNSVLAFFYANLGGALMPALGIIVIAVIILTNQHIFHTPPLNLISFLYLFVRFQTIVANGFNLIGSLFIYRVHLRETFKLISTLSQEELHAAFSPDDDFKLFNTKINYPRRSRSNEMVPAYSNHEERKPPDIYVSDVAFSWPGMDNHVFKSLSLKIPGGSQMGIVGPNGCGKSTLLAIILGALNPTSGKVLINEANSRKFMNHNSQSIGFVGAEPYLIHGTILENLTYGISRKYLDDEIWQVLRIVRLDEFVKELPDDLGHIIQENGEGLSSGQKQRITIARAFLRKPSLLILDEPTANLDDVSESCICNALYDLKGKCTVIIVSHKPGILKKADQTFNLENYKLLNAKEAKQDQ